MPELPEVETVKRGLAPFMEGATLNTCHVHETRFRVPTPQALSALSHVSILSLERRSKFLFIHLQNHHTIVTHLGMSGSLTYTTPDTPLKKHDHITFKISKKGEKPIDIRFNDPRRFGFVDYIETKHLQKHPYIAKLGPEPLSDAFTGDTLYHALKHKKSPIKPAIMDAKVVVGVGNIYACESLFLTGINPTTPCNKITKNQYNQLVNYIKNTLIKAIQAGGSSLKDHKQSDGTLGYFQHAFQVYGRKGQSCYVCQNPIVKIVLAQRGTYYCPNCQK